MPSKARQKKIMEKLNRAQKCSILGPQNLGSRGGASEYIIDASEFWWKMLQSIVLKNIKIINSYILENNVK